MKKALLSLGLLIGLGATAQIQVESNYEYISGASTEWELYTNIEISTTSGAMLRVEAVEVYRNWDAALKYCVGEYCYNNLDPIYQGELGAGESTILKPQYNPFETVDSAVVEFIVSDVNTPNSTEIVTVVFDTQGNSIVARELNTGLFVGKAYPNPASSEVKFSYDIVGTFSTAMIEVRSLTGAVVKQVELNGVNSGMTELSLSQFPAGVYFYGLVVDGVKSETKRLIVNK